MLALFEHLQRRLPDIDERHGIEACEFVSHGLRYHWLVDGQCLTCRTVWPCDEFLIRTRMGASLLGLAS